jgi:hypothetical protein
MITRTDWATLKQVKSTNSFTLYYVQDSTQYTVIEGNRFHQYWTVLREASEVTEFETSYKSSGILVLSLDDALSRMFYPEKTDNDTVFVLNQILTQLGGSGGAVTTVIKDAEFSVTTRNEVDITGTSYTVPTNKIFRITQFGASSDNPSGGIFRLKVYSGVTLLRSIKLVLQSNNGSNSFTWPNGAQIAVAGNSIKITHEAQAAKGTGWCGFSGFEQ